MQGIMLGSGDIKMNKRVPIPVLLEPGVYWTICQLAFLGTMA